jgi:hypothetical protein
MGASRGSLSRSGLLLAAALLGLVAGTPGVATARVGDGGGTAFGIRWAWSVAGDAIGYKGLEVVDLNGDDRPEILAAADPWASGGYWYVLERQGDDLVQIYSSLPRADGVMGLAAGATNGRVSIVVVGSSSLSVYDGASRREMASFPTASTDQRALAVADIDGDGILDAVVCDGSNLYVYELLLGSVRTKFGFGCTDIAIGQTDADPQLEIALAGNASGGFVLDGLSLLVDWADLRGFGYILCLGDFDADGRDEVASQAVDTGGMRIQDPETGALLWEELSGEVSALAAANLDAEAGSELLWGEGQWGTIHLLDGATPAELRAIANPDSGVTAIAVGDTNADGIADVLWGAGWTSSGPDHLYVASSDATAFAARTEDLRAPFPGLAVGDFGGNGGLEVATASSASNSFYSGGVALVLSFANGRLQRSAPGGWPVPFAGRVDAMVSGQLDSDPQLELCLAGDRWLGCYDGADLTEQWLVALADDAYTVQRGELDGDPYPELAVGTETNFVYAFEGETGWLKWRTPSPPLSYPPLDRIRLLDLTGDARQEVVASAARGGGTALTTFDGDSGLLVAGPWSTDVLSLHVLPAAAARESLLVGQNAGGVVEYDPLTGNVGTMLAVFQQGIANFGLADFNRDGTLDIASLLEDHFEVQDGETGATLYVSPYLGYLVGASEAFQVGDFDGNGVPEILTPTGAGLALFQGPLFALFADGFESGDTSNW